MGSQKKFQNPDAMAGSEDIPPVASVENGQNHKDPDFFKHHLTRGVDFR